MALAALLRVSAEREDHHTILAVRDPASRRGFTLRMPTRAARELARLITTPDADDAAQATLPAELTLSGDFPR